MNYKLLFPTYRNRYLFVRDNLQRFCEARKPQNALNLGTGEGDYDPMIAQHCQKLVACDINAGDIAWASQLNRAVTNLEYREEDALALRFEDNYFDLLISVDVMEHVGEPERMTREMARVLKHGGFALVTFPQRHFPITYDPVNYVAGRRLIGQGAYAFGHEYLIDPALFRRWAEAYGLEVLDETSLSGPLVALVEMYWTGIIQRLFKANARNVSENGRGKTGLRPSAKEPFLVPLTDALIALDAWLFGRARRSVGKGFLLRKK